MRFPFEANAVHPEGRFLIQDPEYRKRILPLFDFTREEPERRVEGQGTVFRIDPWGNCATAFHVFEDAFYLGGATGREMLLRQDRSIVALELDGIDRRPAGRTDRVLLRVSGKRLSRRCRLCDGGSHSALAERGPST
ncbi:hypothetical protein [Bradyrhizobium sp. SK17]|uniref:hypothetical protein n=1 Tax=Bradyrhizobium sp. SK17 TaxID=2057741 RepID=UPI0012FE48D3|nr:hypothetical protein [Bradyrhizobium sp. SK17]